MKLLLMGLDQYAIKKDGKEETNLHYWRKHPDLHGWMEKLYREKGGKAESFNASEKVKLTIEDLNKLKLDIVEKNLPHTTGFFFGKSWSNENERNDDLEFIKKAEKAIEEGCDVYYTSWW